MPKSQKFPNTAAIGSFGEFCYEKFIKSKELKIEKMHKWGYDFLVSESYKVDVKATGKDIFKYVGEKKPKIIYDLVKVEESKNKVTIYPDSPSPIYKYIGTEIGPLNLLFDEWKKDKSRKKLSEPKKPHKLKENLITEEIRNLFPHKKIRCIYRYSGHKWRGSPDNLPGSDAIIKKFDITFFVKMLPNQEDPVIQKIYRFDHNSFDNDIQMKIPEKRQSNKNISRVIDLEWFEENYTDLIFPNIAALTKSVSTNQ